MKSFLAVLKIVKYLNKRSPRNPTLSERYQQCENFQTNKTMIWIGAASIALIAVSLICQGAKSIYFTVNGSYEKHMTAVLNVILNIGIGSCLLLMPLAFIFTNDKIYCRYL
uniref:Uncharacterized protein n=1 Tax=Panagrolaimus sp. PS1159 TaxID=55785 RepID=A0AC35FJS1_9BILA